MKVSKNKEENKKVLKSNVNEKGLRSVVDKLLKQDKRLWTKEGKLIENKLIEFVQKDDEDIIKFLLSDPLTKDTFFQKISSVFIFKKDDFINFETMSEFLDGSYTTYSKHIGLANNFSLLKNASEVILNFPYKDCVLEGGQEKGSEGRDEIFYNKILAREEINRLEEEKVLTNWIKYTEKGKEKVISFDHKKDNLILRGNNLLALYSLLPKYRGQIKLIYIDPPYNTGTDDFRYNDNFNHSSWLVFMKNRLETAKKLLHPEGAIFVQCDDSEQGYLKVLMDEVFNQENFLNLITVRAKSVAGASGGGEDKSLKKNTEYINLYSKDKNYLKYYNNTLEVPLFKLIKDKQNDGKDYEYNQVLMEISEKGKIVGKIDSRNGMIPVFEHKRFEIKSVKEIAKSENISIFDVYTKYLDRIFRTQDSQSSIRAKVKVLTEEKPQVFYSIEYVPDSGKNKGKTTSIFYYKGEQVNFLSSTTKIENKEIIKIRPLGSLWDDIGWDGIAKEGGVKLKSGKKPEKLIARIIDLCTKENDIVLDYHLGSGTTCAVAHKMRRRYVGIEQLDYGENDSTIRLQNVINGDATGISKKAKWDKGGSFVYAELAQWNEEYIQEIKKAKTVKDLIKIYEKMSNEAFFVYTFDQSKWDDKKFEELTLDNQKKILSELLNMNHLYINYKDIEDATFKISQEDIKLNKNFYE